MSINDLEIALATNRPAIGVVVSETLFFELINADKIDLRLIKIPLPADKLARQIAKILGPDAPADHVNTVVITLKNHPGLRVVRDVEVGLALSDRGPTSFQIR